jgi:NAD(P)-dependent dehydrogenase (short-subunit alcohol dehydrogenase family)
VHADISDPGKIKLAVKEAVEWFGGCIHVLINNAARTKTILDDEDPMKAFAETIAANLNGAYYLSEAVLPCMPPGLSSIINISSTRALQSEPNTAAYSASKAGLCGLTHSQAITLAGRVRVNAVLPGWINTDPAGEAALRDEDHRWHPVGRVGIPQDIAEMCLFLADEKRSGFITGQEFVVDGGVTKKMVYPE